MGKHTKKYKKMLVKGYKATKINLKHGYSAVDVQGQQWSDKEKNISLGMFLNGFYGYYKKEWQFNRGPKLVNINMNTYKNGYVTLEFDNDLIMTIPSHNIARVSWEKVKGEE